MAATKRNPMGIEACRQKIQTTQLINRLQNHIHGRLKKHPMSDSQVRAALGLLKKTLPDLGAITLATDPGAPVIFQMINRPPKEKR